MSIHLEQASFHYPNATRDSLVNVSLVAEPGSRIVVTGTNGSGKTTLLQLLSGIYDLTDGVIAFDHLPKGNLNLEHLRSSIGDLLSHQQLFEGTLLENIAMGRPAATFENVQWAVEAAKLKKMVSEFPDGYNTHIDPLGRKLPRSVVQKLLIARSIADKPRLLLLEDSFEYIDTNERQVIIDFLFDANKPWTLVAVTADPYVIEKASSVYTMHDGYLASQGGQNQTDPNDKKQK
jgi:ABC-type bacteriocin/lantibiotic exporter with double-glycine peptidase domain